MYGVLLRELLKNESFSQRIISSQGPGMKNCHVAARAH
jgi:hypothetical protein